MSRFPQLSTGAPVGEEPVQRNLLVEVEAIRTWLASHPSVTPNALSVEAGLGRNSLTSLLREVDPEKPTGSRLAKIYRALSNYGFHAPAAGESLYLSPASVEQLQHLSAQGYALRLERDGIWTVLRMAPVEIPAQQAGSQIIIVAAGNDLEHLLNQVVSELTGTSYS